MMLQLLAKLVARPAVADYLIRRAQRTPYFHLPGYMDRWWLFNGYAADDPNKTRSHPWCPYSIRVHHILRKDYDQWPHDHPVDAWSLIAKGWYWEKRDDGFHLRQAGDLMSIKFGEFHSIEEVSEGGVWTIFILGPTKGDWGFRVNGVKIPWRQYLRSRDDPREQDRVN